MEAFFDNVEHLAILIGVVATSIGIVTAIRGWRKSRDEAIAARAQQQMTIDEIAKEFKPNHGSSLVDRLNHLTESVEVHHAKADKLLNENCVDHKIIHDRIDDVFDVIALPHWRRRSEVERLKRERRSKA